MDPRNETIRPKCPDCGCGIGDHHSGRCDVARCGTCGHQRLSCGCPPSEPTRWSGKWPGVAECEEFGWYARLVPGKGWVPCAPEDDGAAHDLNRLYREGRWDATQQRFVRDEPAPAARPARDR